MKHAARAEKAFTLLEMIVVTALFSILFSVLIGIMINSDLFFSKGQNKVTEHMEARKILETVSRSLRQAAPDWFINGTHYPLLVSNNFTRLDYYTPEFDANDAVTGIKKITYKLDPSNASYLLMKEGIEAETAVSGAVSSIRFGAGCAGCSSFNCTTLAADCPVVRLQVTTLKDNPFQLATEIKLQNQNQTLSAGDPVEEPEEGEF
jgi:prepilin-type N-terminal cleavage/methylation domain-containing protein